jgi:WD repeat-containing protein 19
VRKIGDTKILSDQIPLMLCDGELCLYGTTGGKLTTLSLDTHKFSLSMDANDQLSQLVKLQKYQDAWDLCKMLNNEENWRKLGLSCITDLDINFAIRVFRKIGDASLVQSLESIKYIEDINLLSGHCAVILNRFDEGKQLFAKSNNPLEALDLCRDLLQWEQAMALSNNLAHDQLSTLAREFAQQLEMNGNYIEALANYKKSLNENANDASLSEDDEFIDHIHFSEAGIARCSIRCGNFTNGVKIAIKLGDKRLFYECAEALEQMNQTADAANLYEESRSFDKACALYIQLKQWNKVDKILPHITSLKLHALYAKAKESEGKYRDAIKSYKLANDLDSVVRIYLDHMSDPHSASEIVLESRSIESGKMLSKFYQNIGDYESALQVNDENF